MSDKFTPWDDLFGPLPSPENPVTPVPVPIIVPTPTPIPTPSPAPSPLPNPVPSAANQKSGASTIVAASIVCLGLLGAGFFLSGKGQAPQPPTPVVNPSGPVVDASLSKLLPNDEARSLVASYFRDVSTFLSSSKTLKTTGQTIEAILAGSQDLQRAIGASGWAAINTPISERIIRVMGSTPAEGLPDVPLDTPLPSGMTPRQILVKEYAQIGIDARGG
jgi:hypothetical protein